MRIIRKIGILVLLFLIFAINTPVYAKIKKPVLALPSFGAKTKTATSVTLDFSYMAKYYLKGKDAIDGYQIYKKVKGKWKKLSSVKTKGKKKKTIKKTYSDKKLKPGTKYRYRVRTFKKVMRKKTIKKGKKKVTKKYTKTYYSRYENLVVTTKSSNGNTAQPDPPKKQRYDGAGNPIDENGHYIDPFLEENKDYQLKMLNRINEHRVEKGLKPLTLNWTMCEMAAVRAKEASQLFEHRRPDGSLWDTIFDQYNLEYITSAGKVMTVKAVGENLHVAGLGSTWDMTLGDCREIPEGVDKETYIDQGWKQSPGHWNTLMDENINQFGVAHYFDAPPSAEPYMDENLPVYPSIGSYWVAITGAAYEKK